MVWHFFISAPNEISGSLTYLFYTGDHKLRIFVCFFPPSFYPLLPTKNAEVFIFQDLKLFIQ